MAEEDDNIFKKLKNKFQLAVKKVDISNLPDEIRDQCSELEQYHQAILELYFDLMRILNGHPEYDPTIRKEDAYYVAHESPGEKFSAQVGQLRQLMWDSQGFSRYCMRLGMEISEVEKIFQRDGRKQLHHYRDFLFREYPKFAKLKTDCLLAKNKYEVLEDRKKSKAKVEYDELITKVKEFINVKMPEVKRSHVCSLMYFMRCYRQYHVSMRVRYAGIATIKVPRPGL